MKFEICCDCDFQLKIDSPKTNKSENPHNIVTFIVCMNLRGPPWLLPVAHEYSAKRKRESVFDWSSFLRRLIHIQIGITHSFECDMRDGTTCGDIFFVIPLRACVRLGYVNRRTHHLCFALLTQCERYACRRRRSQILLQFMWSGARRRAQTIR